MPSEIVLNEFSNTHVTDSQGTYLEVCTVLHRRHLVLSSVLKEHISHSRQVLSKAKDPTI